MFHKAWVYALLLLSLMGAVFSSGCKEAETDKGNQQRLPTVDGSNTTVEDTQTNQRGDFQKAPAFTLLDVDGKQVSLNAFEGKVTFINFWATWCVPCLREMPDLVELSSPAMCLYPPPDRQLPQGPECIHFDTEVSQFSDNSF